MTLSLKKSHTSAETRLESTFFFLSTPETSKWKPSFDIYDSDYHSSREVALFQSPCVIRKARVSSVSSKGNWAQNWRENNEETSILSEAKGLLSFDKVNVPRKPKRAAASSSSVWSLWRTLVLVRIRRGVAHLQKSPESLQFSSRSLPERNHSILVKGKQVSNAEILSIRNKCSDKSPKGNLVLSLIKERFENYEKRNFCYWHEKMHSSYSFISVFWAVVCEHRFSWHASQSISCANNDCLVMSEYIVRSSSSPTSTTYYI